MACFTSLWVFHPHKFFFFFFFGRAASLHYCTYLLVQLMQEIPAQHKSHLRLGLLIQNLEEQWTLCGAYVTLLPFNSIPTAASQEGFVPKADIQII